MQKTEVHTCATFGKVLITFNFSLGGGLRFVNSGEIKHMSPGDAPHEAMAIEFLNKKREQQKKRS